MRWYRIWDENQFVSPLVGAGLSADSKKAGKVVFGGGNRLAAKKVWFLFIGHHLPSNMVSGPCCSLFSARSACTKVGLRSSEGAAGVLMAQSVSQLLRLAAFSESHQRAAP